MKSTLNLAVAALALVASAAHAQVPYTQGNQIYIASVGNPAVSADGNSFYVWTRPHVPDGGPRTPEVLHYSFDGEPLESGIRRSSPYFSPDGAYHAFKGTDDDGNYGIHVYDVAAEEYRFVAPVYESNAFLGHRARKNLVWSPDSRYVAYVSAEREAEEQGDDPIVIERLLFKSRTGRSDNLRTHIFVVSVQDGETQQLTSSWYDEHSIAWSPDGERIAFISNRADDPDDVHRNDLWTVDVARGALRQITDTPGPEFAPEYSPDGKWIAYRAGERPINTRDSPMENDQLWVVPADGGTPRNLTIPLDRRVRGYQWSGDSRQLFFRVENHGAVHLFRVPVQGGEMLPIVTGDAEVISFAVSPTQDRIVYRMATGERPPELYLTTLDGSWHRQLTQLQDAFAENVTYSPQESIWFESFDGTQVQGWLTKPNPYEPGQAYPLVLTVHGGPHGAYRHGISWVTQKLAENGYGVLQINPRGSVGYGQAFADGTLNDWGGGDYRDLMAGVDYVVGQNAWVDGDRLAVFGYSYGGYMADWIVTQTDRFGAVVAGGSLSNLVSFYGTSLYHLLIETEFPGDVWDNYELLWDRSPLKHVANVKTPVLFLHGEVDKDVPVTQAEEMFVALRKLGVDAEMVLYPGMGHEFSSGAAAMDAFERTVAWFDKYLRQEESRPIP